MSKKKSAKLSKRKRAGSKAKPSKRWSKIVQDCRSEWRNVLTAEGYTQEYLINYLVGGYESDRWSLTAREAAYVTGQKIKFVQDVYEWWAGRRLQTMCFLGVEFANYLEHKRGVAEWTLHELMQKGLHDDHEVLRKKAIARVKAESLLAVDVCQAVHGATGQTLSMKKVKAIMKRAGVPTTLLPRDPYSSVLRLFAFAGVPKDVDQDGDLYMHPLGLREIENQVGKKLLSNPKWRALKRSRSGSDPRP